MPYMLTPANYTQTMRPNLYNMAYRRIGAYKGMGRLHPSNYLEIGTRPNRIGDTAGQYNTLSGQLALNPPSLRGMGAIPVWNFRQRRWVRGPGGLGATTCAYNDLACLQSSTGAWQVIGPPVMNAPPSANADASTADILGQMYMYAAANPNAQPAADYGTGANILDAQGNVLPGVFPTNNTWLYLAGGVLLVMLLGGRR